MNRFYLPWFFVLVVVGVFVLFSFSSYYDSGVYAASAGHVVISEVQIAGVGTGHAGDDFIELYNPSDTAFNLKGFRLVKRTATATSDDSIKSWDSDATIPPHGFYLWANSSIASALSADASTSATLAGDNGIALRQGLADTGSIVDSVGWGAASNAFVEGSPYPSNPPSGASIERKACGSSTSDTMAGSDANNGNAEDTDNNADDFVPRPSPQPQNSLSSPEAPGCASVTSSPSVTASPAASSTPSGMGTPTASPTSSATSTATPTSASSPTSTPQPTASPSPTITPSPTPSGVVFFRPLVFVCHVDYITFNMGWFVISLPQVFCGWNLI